MATARIHLAESQSRAKWSPSDLPEIQELDYNGQLVTGTVVELEDGTKYRYTAPRPGAWRKLRAKKDAAPATKSSK